ncbi:hypothetical protein HZH66_012864 [Vespula vulgaris]|uniref:Uncharacterized protein n=1 Tax=Vespula vulgaris TaxID=7454 RepID=A0A834J7Y2_VESVU|nr:hypothetical protein HZH66_012864 [Vespula vulgaris]
MRKRRRGRWISYQKEVDNIRRDIVVLLPLRAYYQLVVKCRESSFSFHNSTRHYCNGSSSSSSSSGSGNSVVGTEVVDKLGWRNQKENTRIEK